MLETKLTNEQNLILVDIIHQNSATVAETVAEPIDPSVFDLGGLVMTNRASSEFGDEDDD